MGPAGIRCPAYRVQGHPYEAEEAPAVVPSFESDSCPRAGIETNCIDMQGLKRGAAAGGGLD